MCAVSSFPDLLTLSFETREAIIVFFFRKRPMKLEACKSSKTIENGQLEFCVSRWLNGTKIKNPLCDVVKNGHTTQHFFVNRVGK